MGKEHSQNVEPDLAIALSRTPCFGDFPTLGLYPTTITARTTRGVSYCGLAIYIKKYLKAKEEL
jgi:hypothetical protein